MSTYVRLACLDHDPPLLADAESDQHRHKPGVMDQIPLYLDGMLDTLSNTLRFLAGHRACRIAAQDENGVWLDLGQGTPSARPEPDDIGLLTEAEHRAVHMAGDLWGLLCSITTGGLARSGDLDELRFHIHGIQRAVLKQAAARAYPDLYRLLGGDPPPMPAGEWPDSETITEQQAAVPRPPARPPLLPDPVIPST